MGCRPSILRLRRNAWSTLIPPRVSLSHLAHAPALSRQIITRLTVRLTPIVPLTVALTSFPTVKAATSFVVSLLSAGVSPISLELLDGTSIKGLNLAQILPYTLSEEPTVFVRLRKGEGEGEGREMKEVRRLVVANDGGELRVGKDDKENERIWMARKVSLRLRFTRFWIMF